MSEVVKEILRTFAWVFAVVSVAGLALAFCVLLNLLGVENPVGVTFDALGFAALVGLTEAKLRGRL